MSTALQIPIKTVAVLGASYGGARAAHLLAQGLPHAWRVVLIDRNSHMNHLYVLPRYSLLPGHEHKAFIPYSNVFQPPPSADSPSSPPLPPNSPHVFLHASVTSLASHSLTLDRPFPEHGISTSDRTLHFDYLVYALGSHLPAPINIWGPVADEDVEHSDVLDIARGTKHGGIAWLNKFQKRVERASSVLVVGGGALGIQFATDIAEIHPTTQVTLLHSRNRLLPRFDEGMHTEVLSSLSMLNVCTILGDRLDLSSVAEKRTRNGERVVRTQNGREITAELVLLCTGQTPNTALVKEAFPQSVIPNGPDKGSVRVRRTMQLAEPVPVDDLLAQLSLPSSESSRSIDDVADDQEEDLGPDTEEDPATRVLAEHIFAIGDAADAFGAINAGHNAFFQGDVAAANILKLIARAEHTSSGEDVVLNKYAPGLPAIKVTLGLSKCVYQYNGLIGTRDQEAADLDVHLMWRFFGYPKAERGDLVLGYGEQSVTAERIVVGAHATTESAATHAAQAGEEAGMGRRRELELEEAVPTQAVALAA